MKHLLVLGLTSCAFLLLATLACRYDVARHDARTAEAALQLSQELLKFELSYLQAAQALLQLSGEERLLEEVQSYESRRQLLTTKDEQEALFQNLVTRIKAQLLLRMDKGMSESLAQEWRRSADQMQGALTRRMQVLREMPSQP